jgi:hypothetical protein
MYGPAAWPMPEKDPHQLLELLVYSKSQPTDRWTFGGCPFGNTPIWSRTLTAIFEAERFVLTGVWNA